MNGKMARHHWSDWAGFAFSLLFAVLIWSRSTELGILILPGLLYDLSLAGAFLLRGPARARDRSLPARLAAYGGSFVMLAFLQSAAWWRPSWVAGAADRRIWLAGSLLWLAGSAGLLWPLWHLRRSFSLEPQARSLVRTGPYRWVRHPIYSAYALSYLGLWVSHPTVLLALAVAAWSLCTAARIHFEEAVLRRTFAEYDDYRRQAGALLPRLRSTREVAADA